MSSRTPARARLRAAALLVTGVVALSGVAACGHENDGDGEGDAGKDSSSESTESTESPESPGEGESPTATEDPAILDSITATGEFGQAPEVTFDGALDPAALVTKELIKGDGEEVAEGDQAYVNLWIASAKTQKEGFSSYKTGPEAIPVDPAQVPQFILGGVQDLTVGTRTLVAAPAADAYGEQGNPELGIGANEPVVVIVDVMSKVLKEPAGTEQQPAAWAPEVTETDGLPSSLKFGATEAPDGLQVTTLIEGEGAPVKKGDVIFVNYLGQVPGSNKPFDASYGREPFSFPVGAGQVVKGWDQALPGVTVGSRIIVAIPPELGYKAAGKPEAGIKGTDTMYFVVDVLGAG